MGLPGREPAVYGLRDAEVKIKLVHPDITGGAPGGRRAWLSEARHCPLLGTARSAEQQAKFGNLRDHAMVCLESGKVSIFRIARFILEVVPFSKMPKLPNTHPPTVETRTLRHHRLPKFHARF